jgi:rhodanese-related sulfurtransferase
MKPIKNDPAAAQRYFEARLACSCGPVELNGWIESKEAGVNVVDVRRTEDYEKGHIPGAVNLPKEKWDSLEGLSKDKLNVLYCYSHVCHLAPQAALEFSKKGYSVMELEGGFDEWRKYGLATQALEAARR